MRLPRNVRPSRAVAPWLPTSMPWLTHTPRVLPQKEVCARVRKPDLGAAYFRCHYFSAKGHRSEAFLKHGNDQKNPSNKNKAKLSFFALAVTLCAHVHMCARTCYAHAWFKELIPGPSGLKLIALLSLSEHRSSRCGSPLWAWQFLKWASGSCGSFMDYGKRR